MLDSSMIKRFENLQDLDRARIITLLEDSFGRKLISSGFLNKISVIYLAGNYNGIALLRERPEGMYLTKFAVSTTARGGGLAGELWQVLTLNHQSFFWRAKVINPFCAWYEQRSDGFQQLNDWKIFWHGISPAHIPAVINFAAELAGDFD